MRERRIMSDNFQGNNFTPLSAAATTLIADRQCTFEGLTRLGTDNGTIIFYNVPTAAGTAAGNAIGTFPILTTLNTLNTTQLHINCSNGLVAAVTGTVSVAVSWR